MPEVSPWYFDEDPESEEEEEEKKTVLILFLDLSVKVAVAQNNAHTAALAAGRMTLHEWSAATSSTLYDANAAAYSTGFLKGRRVLTSAEQSQAAAELWDEQSFFFTRFKNDIDSGRYIDSLGNLDQAAIERRLAMYGERIRGSANQGSLKALSARSKRVRWRTGDLEHCTPSEGFVFTCPELESRGWMWASDMPTAPKACQTPCLFNCGCWIETEDGERSF